MWAKKTMEGWGRTTRVTLPTLEASDRQQLVAGFCDHSQGSLLANNSLRSYGDQAIPAGGRAISTRHLTGISEFDPDTATVTAEAGVTIRQLLDYLVPKGFMPGTCPGTGFASVAGAIANDVHGKNHEHDGSFCDHLVWFDLLVADGSVLRVSEYSDPELFRATIGGCGLTGIILAAGLRLLPAPSNAVLLRERRIINLEDFFQQIEAARRAARFSIGWIDALSRGPTLGRGILETAEPVDQSVPEPSRRTLTMPFQLPSYSLNKLTVKAFNALYYRRVPKGGRTRLLALPKFLFPLDAILRWNRIYGRRGFDQFQCVTPEAQSFEATRRMLEEISAAGIGSFLAVLKSLGRQGKGYLSFPMPGYTLALDIPRRPGSHTLMKKLEAITLEAGGRCYFAKDACLSPESVRAMYPQFEQFVATVRRIDPEQRFDSLMAERLRLHSEA